MFFEKIKLALGIPIFWIVFPLIVIRDLYYQIPE